MKSLLIAAIILMHGLAYAQMPKTRIWLFKLDPKKDLFIKEGKCIVDRNGYDNQPSFNKNANGIFFVSDRGGAQTDIYYLKLSGLKIKQVTNTLESEYSPRELKSNDNKLSCVRVLKDSSQVIQVYDQKTKTFSDDKMAAIDSIGYYEFLNEDSLLYYKLTEPHSLQLFDRTNSSSHFICSKPARSFKKINRYSFIFGITDSAATKYYLFDTRIKKAEPYTSCDFNGQDFIYDDQFGLVASDKTRIKRFDYNSGTWVDMFDLSPYAIKSISRFIFDPKHKYLIVVDAKM